MLKTFKSLQVKVYRKLRNYKNQQTAFNNKGSSNVINVVPHKLTSYAIIITLIE